MNRLEQIRKRLAFFPGEGQHMGHEDLALLLAVAEAASELSEWFSDPQVPHGSRGGADCDCDECNDIMGLQSALATIRRLDEGPGEGT
jgi:hypothetical protein